MSQHTEAERESSFPSPLCSTPVLSGLKDIAHVGEGRSSLFTLLVHMLISSRNTLTDTSRTK